MPSDDVRVTPEGELIVSTFTRSDNSQVRLVMNKRDLAKFILMLQTCLRGMNGEEPWPDYIEVPHAS